MDSLYNLQDFVCIYAINVLHSYLLDSYILHSFHSFFYLYYQSTIDHKIKKISVPNTSFNKVLYELWTKTEIMVKGNLETEIAMSF